MDRIINATAIQNVSIMLSERWAFMRKMYSTVGLVIFSLSIFDKGGFLRYPLKLPLQITKSK